MSQKNREGKQNARARLQAERQRQEQRRQRNKRLAVFGSVGGVIVIAVLIALLVSNSSGSGGFPGGKVYVPPNNTLTGAEVAASGVQGGAGKDGIAIGYGPSNAPVKLTVFEDFRCPVCDAMEKAGVGAAMQQYAADGKIQIQYHIASFIDRNDGGNGSKQAANAAACAQDVSVEDFIAYHNVLYANQPAETDDAYGSTSTLLSVAAKVPGLVTPTFTQCVNNDVHAGWVTASQNDFDQRGITGTPTVILDGSAVTVTATSQSQLGTSQYSSQGIITVPYFDQIINAELAKKGIATETPTPTGIPAPTIPATPSPAATSTLPATKPTAAGPTASSTR